MHPKHPPFVQNIKTVSQNGTAADHNGVSFPAGVDSFTAANHVTSSKQPKKNWKSFATEVEFHNIFKQTQRLNLDRAIKNLDFDSRKMEVAQREWTKDLEAEFASVIYVEIRNKLLDFAPENKKPEATKERMSDKDFDKVRTSVTSTNKDVMSPEFGKVTLQRNIKTVSKSGIAADHNDISPVADIKSFASHRSTNQKPAFGNKEVGARSRDQIENIKAMTSSESDKNVKLQKSEDVYYDSQNNFAEEETE
jgi:hypothetical protein